ILPAPAGLMLAHSLSEATMRRVFALLLVPSLLVGCNDDVVPTDPALADGGVALNRGAAPSGVPSSATIRFGDPRAGSPFHPAEEHDRSYHAEDKLVPRTVVISVGGTVTFEVAPTHRVAIYDDGTQPSDIEASPATLEPAPFLGIPNFQINDPTNRLALESPGAFLSQRTFQYTFNEPGRYLVICVTTPHFVFGDMYGWVIVK
ncbi:MAG: hypothetical protein M3220_13115, partial [Chloroflexota bacterium]|nr:hypothetical protein [Chloroflexota bacterium]